MPKAFKDQIVCFSGEFPAPLQQIRQWCDHNNAVFQSSADFSPETTHLVVSQAHWEQRAPVVRAALARSDNHHVVHVVDYEWFYDSLLKQSKQREKPYTWQTKEKEAAKEAARQRKAAEREQAKAAKAAAKKAEKEAKKAAREREKQARKKRGRVDYVGALTEHTNKFMPDEEIEAIKTQADKKAAARKEAEREYATSVQAMKFADGVAKARSDLSSGNHHVYTDATGFRYDINLTKVDILHNRNERINLTWYEHNDHLSYAVHVRHTGTNTVPRSSTASAIGSNWETARRVFRKVFREYTHVEWEDRVDAFERTKRAGVHSAPGGGMRQRQQQQQAKSMGGSEQGGRNNATTALSQQQTKAPPKNTACDWASMPFLYRLPPPDEPRGTLPDSALLQQLQEDGRMETNASATVPKEDVTMRGTSSDSSAEDKTATAAAVPMKREPDDDEGSPVHKRCRTSPSNSNSGPEAELSYSSCSGIGAVAGSYYPSIEDLKSTESEDAGMDDAFANAHVPAVSRGGSVQGHVVPADAVAAEHGVHSCGNASQQGVLLGAEDIERPMNESLREQQYFGGLLSSGAPNDTGATATKPLDFGAFNLGTAVAMDLPLPSTNDSSWTGYGVLSGVASAAEPVTLGAFAPGAEVAADIQDVNSSREVSDIVSGQKAVAGQTALGTSDDMLDPSLVAGQQGIEDVGAPEDGSAQGPAFAGFEGVAGTVSSITEVSAIGEIMVASSTDLARDAAGGVESAATAGEYAV